jgi:hypothetical protein
MVPLRQLYLSILSYPILSCRVRTNLTGCSVDMLISCRCGSDRFQTKIDYDDAIGVLWLFTSSAYSINRSIQFGDKHLLPSRLSYLEWWITCKRQNALHSSGWSEAERILWLGIRSSLLIVFIVSFVCIERTSPNRFSWGARCSIPIMLVENNEYILCSDEPSLTDAIAALRLSSAIIFDCEGVDLGLQGGCLCLLSLRPTTTTTMMPTTSKTYLVDTISLTRDKLRPLFDILESPSPLKIVFDGRMDFSELFHSYGVSMKGVLDLQLADIYSRPLRGDTEQNRRRRLSPFFPRNQVRAQPALYASLQKLSGLNQCIRHHNLVTMSFFGEQSGKDVLS